MNFKEIKELSDSNEKISKIYDIFDEEVRLQTKSGRIEFFTTTAYVDQLLDKKKNILDLGAGTGVYSFYYDNLGHEVTAVELAQRNYDMFKSKLTSEHKIDLHHRSAVDLSIFEDDSFDIILLLGPLYHLEDHDDISQCLNEAKRVLKDDGVIFIAFINNDFIPISETVFNNDYFSVGNYNHDTFQMHNFPFVFYDLDRAKELLNANKLRIEKAIASDGYSEVIQDQINKMSDETYEQYIKYHLHFCEQESSLSATNHFLFQCKKVDKN